jgi:hypothetical protein
MTRVKALVGLHAFGYVKSAGEEFEIKNKGQRLDLEKLGWIEPLEYEVGAVSEDMKVTEVKKTIKAKKTKKN